MKFSTAIQMAYNTLNERCLTVCLFVFFLALTNKHLIPNLKSVQNLGPCFVTCDTTRIHIQRQLNGKET